MVLAEAGKAGFFQERIKEVTAAIIIIHYRVLVTVEGCWTYIITEIHHFTIFFH